MSAAVTIVRLPTTNQRGYAASELSIAEISFDESTASVKPRPRRDSKQNDLPGASPARPTLSRPMNSKPQLLAWLTCDGVHIDPGTGKHTILGVFSDIHAHTFPFAHPFMIWFLTLTDCAPGTHQMRISLGLDPQAMQPLIERPFEVKSPLNRINLINEIRGLVFPAPGDYSLLVEIDDEPLLATSLTVAQARG